MAFEAALAGLHLFLECKYNSKRLIPKLSHTYVVLYGAYAGHAMMRGVSYLPQQKAATNV